MLWSDIEQAIGRPMRMDDPRHIDIALRYVRRKNTELDAQPTTTTPRTETPAPPAAAAAPAAAAGPAGGAVEADGLKGRETAIAAFKRAAEAKFPGRDTVRTAEMAADRLLPMIEAKNADGLIDMNLGSADMNPASRAAFEAVTGVKLPKGRAATERAIDGWAGVTEQQRSEKDAARNAQREADGAKKDAEWARKSAATVQVKDGDRTVDGASWVDELIAKGFTKIVRRGPKTFLANEAGNGWPMMHKDIAEYARKASAVPTPNATAPVEAASAADQSVDRADAMGLKGQDRRAAIEGDAAAPDTSLKDRVDAKRKPADPVSAPPSADSQTATAQLAGADPTDKNSLTVAEPKTKRPPKSFRKKHIITTSAFVEESGKFEQREVDADAAMKALDEDISELAKFRKCIAGG